MTMSSTERTVDSVYKMMSDSQMDDNKHLYSDKTFEETMDQFYDIVVDEEGVEWFQCTCNGCNDIQRNESDIIEHLRQHFSKVSDNVVKLEVSDNSEGHRIECKPDVNSFLPNVECINISDEDTVESNPNHNLREQTGDNWEQYCDSRIVNGRQKFFCLVSNDCSFESVLRMKIKTHIIKHLQTLNNSSDNTNGLTNGFNEADYWNSCTEDLFKIETNFSEMQSPIAESSPKINPKNNSKRKSKSVSKSKAKTQSKSVSAPDLEFNGCRRETRAMSQTPKMSASGADISDLIDINFNHNNTILSLKGMASVKKLEHYIQCRVIDGFKYFCCFYNQKCEFKSRRSQETANHVHCAHLGFYLKCVRPNCDKIFRTPGSWREHQKNHICNFGLYGYQKGVTGKCRNEYLLQYQDKIIVENNHKAYRCKWKGCNFITRQRTACKRHIHNNHVCPYRKNKEWKKQLVYYMENNSYLSDRPIPKAVEKSVKSKKVFFCRRTQCNASLKSEAELRRHENLICSYRNSNKNISKNNSKPKTVKSSTSLTPLTSMPSTSKSNVSLNGNKEMSEKNTKSKEKVRQKDKQISNTVETNAQNLKQSDIRSKCEKLIERQCFEGINYILCTAPNCKFTTKNEDKIYGHITKSHSLLTQSAANYTPLRATRRRNSSFDMNETTAKRHKSSGNNSHQSSQHLRQNTTEISNKSPNASTSRKSIQSVSEISPKITQKSNKSEDNNQFKDYYEVKRIESEPNYFCKYPGSQCRFYAKLKKELFEHISQIHIVFKCDVNGCNREFKTNSILEQHKRNHICGFGIKGMKASGVCSLENVRQYRKEVVKNARYHYECKICGFVSESASKLLSHAHNRHIHPAPPPQ